MRTVTPVPSLQGRGSTPTSVWREGNRQRKEGQRLEKLSDVNSQRSHAVPALLPREPFVPRNLVAWTKNDIIYFFSQSRAVFFRHRNNLTPQHQIVGQVIEVSVICTRDNVLGKQPRTWFSWEGPHCPQQHCKAIEGLEWKKCIWKGSPRALACCWARRKLEFSLLLKSRPTVQTSINSINNY